MKKGMCVTLEDNKEYCIVDQVEYNGDLFFAANCLDAEEIKFFRKVLIDNDEGLEEIDESNYPEVIGALSNHIVNTFNS